MKKAVVLARVSTSDQDSTGAQLERLEPYIEAKELKVIKTFEITESSTKDTRKRFDEMIAFIKRQKEPVALVTDTIDRLQRDFRESVLLDDMRKKELIELHFYRENLVLNQESNSADLLRWDMGVMFAKSYVLQLRDNVKRKLESKVQNGEYPGKAPIGYLNVNIDGSISIKKDPRPGPKTIVPDPDRKHYIQKVFDLYATGNYSYAGLAKHMRKEGFILRNGKGVSKSTISDIIHNPFYFGEMVYNEKQYPHIYEPIVTRWIYDKCHEVIASHNRTPYKYGCRKFVFKGLINCCECGKTLSTYHSRKMDYNYVQCHNPECRGIHLREDIYVEQIAKVLKGLQIPKDVLEDVTSALAETHEREQSFYKVSIGNLESRLGQVRKAIESAYEDRCFGRITTNEYDKYVRNWKAEETDLIEQIKDHSNADGDFLITANYVLDLANRAYDLFMASNAEQKRQIVNLLFMNLEGHPEKLIYKLKAPLGAVLIAGKSQNWLPGLDSNQGQAG